MLRAPVGDIDVEYEVRGSGEPVVLIHAGVLADWFTRLLDEPALADYQLIRYHRVGYAGSGRIDGPVSLRDQAAHCRSLLHHLGVTRAHVVGHSSSANIALQVALDHPDAVQTLALLEIALLAVPSGAYAPEAMQRYRDGDRAGAVDVWMRGVAGPGYRDTLDRVLPGAYDRAVADADTFFGQELPAVREWPFGPDEAGRVEAPALLVLGGRSSEVTPVFEQRNDLLGSWLSNVERFVLPDATHLLHVQNPSGLAEELARFFGRHPLPPRP
jgi:pimeloyl-ACP methyl ester carboxylesterase